MTPTSAGPEEPRRQWAADQLGVPADARPDEVRAAFLRGLPADGFVPPPEGERALRVLAVSSVPGWARQADGDTARADERRLRQEVEAFAGRYWDLVPTERRARWQELSSRAIPYPQLAARVASLQAGLDISGEMPCEPPGARLAQLASRVRDLFVLRVQPRARARQALLAGMGASWPEWKAAAQELNRRHAAVAALQPALVKELASWTPPRPRVPSVPQAPARAPAGTQTSGAGWAVYVVVMIVIGIFRAMFSSTDRTPQVKPPPTTFRPMPKVVVPPFNPPPLPPNPGGPDWFRRDAEERMNQILKGHRIDPGRDAVRRFLEEQDPLNNQRRLPPRPGGPPRPGQPPRQRTVPGMDPPAGPFPRPPQRQVP